MLIGPDRSHANNPSGWQQLTSGQAAITVSRQVLSMPLIFIHGVNTRDTDPDYFVASSARRKLFDDIVGTHLRGRFTNFQVLPDIYWAISE